LVLRHLVGVLRYALRYHASVENDGDCDSDRVGFIENRPDSAERHAAWGKFGEFANYQTIRDRCAVPGYGARA
jgi:hypothetical protein